MREAKGRARCMRRGNRLTAASPKRSTSIRSATRQCIQGVVHVSEVTAPCHLPWLHPNAGHGFRNAPPSAARSIGGGAKAYSQPPCHHASSFTSATLRWDRGGRRATSASRERDVEWDHLGCTETTSVSARRKGQDFLPDAVFPDAPKAPACPTKTHADTSALRECGRSCQTSRPPPPGAPDCIPRR